MKDIKEIYGGAATYKSTSTNTLLNFWNYQWNLRIG